MAVLEPPVHHMPSVPTTSGTYRAIVLQTLDDFQAMAEPWDDLLARAGIRNLTLTHGWLTTWLKHFSPERQLVVMVQDDTGRWVGAAPLMIRRIPRGLFRRMLRCVQFIGTNPTVYDWMTCMVDPQADAGAVMAAVANELLAERDHWDMLDLQFGPDESQLRLLSECLSGQTVQQTLRPAMGMPWITLPDTEEAYEASLHRKVRWEIRRTAEKIQEDYPDFPLSITFPDPEKPDTEAMLTDFFNRHMSYWANRGQGSDFARYEGLTDFYREALKLGDNSMTPHSRPKLLFSVCRLGATPLAYSLDFWQGNGLLCHVISYNVDYADYHPGFLHMSNMVRECVRHGAEIFEFGRGEEPYKRKWTRDNPPRPLWNLRICKNLKATVLWRADSLIKWLLRKPDV